MEGIQSEAWEDILHTRLTVPLVLVHFVPAAGCKPSARVLPHSRATAPVPAIKIRFHPDKD
jgi:hypothetical protein